MADISDAELAELRKAHNLLLSLHGDAETSIELQKLVNKKFPKAKSAELAAVERIEAAETNIGKKAEESNAEVRKMVQDLIDERKKEKEEAQIESFQARVTRVAEERGYTKEGTDKLLEVMKERGISNPEDAAVIFESRQPKPKPEYKPHSTRMNFISPDSKDDPDFKRLMDDPEQYMVDEMLSAIRNGNTQ